MRARYKRLVARPILAALIFSALIILFLWCLGVVREYRSVQHFTSSYDLAELPPKHYFPRRLAADNAAHYYIRATEILDIDEGDRRILREFDLRPEGLKAEDMLIRISRMVWQNSGALEMLRLGADAPRSRFGIIDDEHTNFFGDMMFLGKLLLCEAYLRLVDEDYDAAVDVIRTSGALASSLEQDPRSDLVELGTFVEHFQLLIIGRLLEVEDMSPSLLKSLGGVLVDTDLAEAFRRAVAFDAARFHLEVRLFYASLRKESIFSRENGFRRAAAIRTAWLWGAYAKAAELDRVVYWMEASRLDYIGGCSAMKTRIQERRGMFSPFWEELLMCYNEFLAAVKTTAALRELAGLALEVRLQAAHQRPEGLENLLVAGRRESFSGSALQLVKDPGGTVTVAPASIELIKSGAICREVGAPDSCCKRIRWPEQPPPPYESHLFEIKVAAPGQ